jgi:hypothetical protein
MNTSRRSQRSLDDLLALADTELSLASRWPSVTLLLRAASNRRALLARDRVMGCRMVVGLAAMIVVGASIIGLVKDMPAAFVVAGFGVILLGGAIALLRQAHRQLAALTARRHALAQQFEGRRVMSTQGS